jgi:hypothetical protein
MDQAIFDELQSTLAGAGPKAAIEKLCDALRAGKDYNNLFYAMLLKARHELGASPVPMGASQDLKPEMHQPYENAIREAGRLVGNLVLQEGNIPHAWAFFRMLGETEPVAKAIENYVPKEDEDLQPIIDIAFHQNVLPKKGFDLILERYGICSSITILSGHEFPAGTDTRDYCIKRLVRALYDELRARLVAEITRTQQFEPKAQSVAELIQGRDWLFADEFYHIDVSHLSSVVQMAANLGKCEELELARELCQYGQRLSPRFQFNSDPPFENQYRDYAVYLGILAGDQVEEGLAHFRAKAEQADPETVGTYPAEVLVNLLLRLDRPHEALAVARRFLANTDESRLSCPTIVDLCQRTDSFDTLAEVARAQNNPVHFLAGLLAAKNRT